MTEKRNQVDYLQKALVYDALAQFYKYTNPQLHIHFYGKHYKYMHKASNIMRSEAEEQPGNATIRFLHTSQDSPNLDVYLNGSRVIKDLPFTQLSQELTLTGGKYHVDIYPAGDTLNSVLNKRITIDSGKSYTLTTIDSVKKMRLLAYLNEPEVPANEAKVRFIHLSADSEPFDIAVKDRDVLFADVAYKQATNYLGLTPMTVDLEVRKAGSKEVIIPMPQTPFKANESYTIVFLGSANGARELQFITIKDK